MVIDTSALFGLVADEPEAEAIKKRLLEADCLLISAVTLMETMIVLFAR